MQTEIILSQLNDETLLVLDELVDRPERKRKDGTVIPASRGLLRIGRSTWCAGIKSGKYPKPVKLGPQKRAWRAGDIKALINTQQAS